MGKTIFPEYVLFICFDDENLKFILYEIERQTFSGKSAGQ
jgi:hypothetical protein